MVNKTIKGGFVITKSYKNEILEICKYINFYNSYSVKIKTTRLTGGLLKPYKGFFLVVSL